MSSKDFKIVLSLSVTPFSSSDKPGRRRYGLFIDLPEGAIQLSAGTKGQMVAEFRKCKLALRGNWAPARSLAAILGQVVDRRAM